MLKTWWVRVVIIFLVVGLAVGQVAATTYRVDHLATATMISAGLAITAAAQYAIATCPSWCPAVWSSVTLATAATAEMVAMGLFYGGTLGLGALAVYMLYKGITWTVDHIASIPGAGYAPVSGSPTGVQSWTWLGSADQVIGYNSGTCQQGYPCPTGSWTCSNNSSLSYGGWGAWCYSGGWNARTIWPPCTHLDWMGANVIANPTKQQIQDLVAADIAGTNGSTAQADALAAAKAVVAAYGQNWDLAAPALKDPDKALPVPWPMGLPLTAWQRAQQLLVDAMPQSAKDRLAAYDAAQQNIAYGPNPTTANMTKTDFRDAVRDGVKTAVEDANLAKNKAESAPSVVVNVPAIEWGTFSGEALDDNGTPGGPTKENLTTVLTGAMTQWRALPILSWLSDYHIEVSNESSVLVLPVPW